MQTLQNNFLGTPLTPTITVSTRYTPLTVCPSMCLLETQRQEPGLVGAGNIFQALGSVCKERNLAGHFQDQVGSYSSQDHEEFV